MPIRMLALVTGGIAFVAGGHVAAADENCPRTVGASKVFSEPWPQADTWFESEALAIMLPKSGIWKTTVPGHRIAVKLFWYSKEFQAVAERDVYSGAHLGF